MKRLILLCLLCTLALPTYALPFFDKTVTLEDLGLLQLAAHDLFNVDRSNNVDLENGKLDLSTLLDHGYENIHLGGEPRNRENIALATVSQNYGNLYLQYRAQGYSALEARNKLLGKYHQELAEAYEHAFDAPMPAPQQGTATLTENLALRTIHDFLPASLELNGTEFSTLDPFLRGKTLTDAELQQKSGPLDGEFDPLFRNITIFIPPSTIMVIDLLEKDSSFADQFNTDFPFELFLEELEDESYDQDEISFQLIQSLFAKGLYLNNVCFDYGTETSFLCAEKKQTQPSKKSSNARDKIRVGSIHNDPYAYPGQQYVTSISLENIYEEDMHDIRVTAIVRELGIKSRTIKVDIADDTKESAFLLLDIPRYAEPGHYYVTLVVDTDGDRRIKHRPFEIV